MNSFGEAKEYDWKVTVFLQWKHHFPQEQFSHDALLNDTIKAPLPNSSEDKLPKSNLAYASFDMNGTDVWCGIGDQTKLVPPHSCRICLGGGSPFSAAQALPSSRTVVWGSSERHNQNHHLLTFIKGQAPKVSMEWNQLLKPVGRQQFQWSGVLIMNPILGHGLLFFSPMNSSHHSNRILFWYTVEDMEMGLLPQRGSNACCEMHIIHDALTLAAEEKLPFTGSVMPNSFIQP